MNALGAERPTRPQLVALSILLATGIFLLDVRLPHGVAGGIPYIVLVLVSWWSSRRRYTVFSALAGTLLTMLGFVLSPAGSDYGMVIFNRFLAIFAIWVTAILFLHIKRAEKEQRGSLREARAAEVKFRGLLESAPDAIVIVDRERRIVLVNRQAEKLFGYEREELLGETVEKLVPGPLRNRHVEHYASFYSNPLTRSMGEGLDLVAQRKDGSHIPVEISLSPLETEGGVLVSSIIRDISERRQAEKALQESEERYRQLVEVSPEAIVVHSEGKILFANRAGVEIHGAKNIEEIVGKSVLDFQAPEARARIKERLKKVYEEGAQVPPIEVQLRGLDGKVRDVESTVGRIIFDGKVAGMSVVRDITERKQLEAQLMQAQKMEAVGQLAGGVAHDFNNLLMLIGGYSELLLNQLREKDPLRANVEEIYKATERATSLTQQLLAFSRKQVMIPKVLDLNDVVADTERMLRRLIGEDIELVTELAQDLGRVRADPGQMDQVIMNLAVNSRDAMPQGGKLIIETANTELGKAYSVQHQPVEPGSYVMLAVTDTGSGMSEETLARIFEPFYTTKEKGRGTGLGLSTVYGIVRQSGGYVWAYSELGIGTTFKIYLPRLDEEMKTSEEQDRSKPEQARGTETVLLVEDDNSVRKLALEFLEVQGYKVLEARSGVEAVRIGEEYESSIHVLMTDVVMPGMSGKELSERLAVSRPEAQVLFMSGYIDDMIVHHGVLEEGATLLQKPFTMNTLAGKLREVLDKRKQKTQGRRRK